MCNFISYIEYKEEILFLTNKELDSPKGKKLKKYLGAQYDNDKIGHGAIEWYFDLKPQSGVHKECEDFSTPNNFPKQIVSAIKKGNFCGLGICEAILTKKALAEYGKVERPALAEYQKVERLALAEYEKVKRPALAEYQKVERPALAEYQKVKRLAWAEYQKVERPALAEYEKVKRIAWAEYEKVERLAWAEYEKVKRLAWAEYEKVKRLAFWRIAKQPKNRIAAWR